MSKGESLIVPGLDRDSARDRINILLAEKQPDEEKRIREALKSFFKNPNSLTNILGANKGNISMEFMAICAQQLGISLDYILYGKIESLLSSDKKFIDIPYIEDRTTNDNDLVYHADGKTCTGRHDILLQITKNPEALVIKKVLSDCMERTISKNDEILIDVLDKNIIDGGIYAFNSMVFKHIQIRRFFIQINEVKLIADNREYESYLANVKDLYIIGRVALCRHFLR
jgi:hypothetical protein